MQDTHRWKTVSVRTADWHVLVALQIARGTAQWSPHPFHQRLRKTSLAKWLGKLGGSAKVARLANVASAA